MILPGCGGGGSIPEFDPLTGDDFFRASNVVVKPEVVVLGNETVIESRTDTGVVLGGVLPALVVGSVIVSGEGPGMMRRVTAITPVGDALELETVDAALTDVFESADIEFSRGLNPAYVQENIVHVPGATFGDAAPATSRGRAAIDFPFGIPKTFVGQQEGAERFGVELESSGRLYMAVVGNIVISSANGLELCSIGCHARWIGSYKCGLVGETAVFQKEIPIATEIFSPITIGFVGPIPLVLLPVLHVQFAAKGSVKGGFRFEGTCDTKVGAGLAYVQTPLGAPISADQFGITGTASSTGEIDTANFFYSFKFEATPMQLELQTSLNALVGPTFKVDAPAGAVELTRLLNDNRTDLKIDAIIRARAGAKAGLLGIASLPLFEVALTERKFPLFHHEFQPGDSDVGIS